MRDAKRDAVISTERHVTQKPKQLGSLQNIEASVVRHTRSNKNAYGAPPTSPSTVKIYQDALLRHVTSKGRERGHTEEKSRDSRRILGLAAVR